MQLATDVLVQVMVITTLPLVAMGQWVPAVFWLVLMYFINQQTTYDWSLLYIAYLIIILFSMLIRGTFGWIVGR